MQPLGGELLASWRCCASYSPIADTGRAVCAYEPLSNHDGLGTNMLFWDGHVTWYDAPQAKRIVAELDAGHNPPRGDVLNLR